MSPGPAGLTQLQELVNRIIAISVYFGFFAFFIMLIWNGFMYLTSSGKPEKIKNANEGMIWAFLGLIFLAVAWLILLLIKTFTGVNVVSFCLGFKPFC